MIEYGVRWARKDGGTDGGTGVEPAPDREVAEAYVRAEAEHSPYVGVVVAREITGWTEVGA